MQMTHEHHELKRNLQRFIDDQINPFVDGWQAATIFPAHELFMKMNGQALLGISNPHPIRP